MRDINLKGLEEAIAVAEEKLRQQDIERDSQIAELVPILQVQLESRDFRALVGIPRVIQETCHVLQYQGRDTRILFLKAPDDGRHQFFLMNGAHKPMYLPLSPEQIQVLAYTWLEDTDIWGRSSESVAITFWLSLEAAVQAEARIFSDDTDDFISHSRQYTVDYAEKQQQSLPCGLLGIVGICAAGGALTVLVSYLVPFLYHFIL